jgi:hypothetical protein
MKTAAKSAVLALSMLVLSAGAALAAEACACCKDGETMACCDKMKGEAAPADAAKPGQPAHKH